MIPKVIGFDFDGVITVAGERAKQVGWSVLLMELVAEGHPKNLPEVFAAEQERFVGKNAVVKGDRYDILWGMWRGLNYPGEKCCTLVNECAWRYDSITRKLIVESGVHPSTHLALQNWKRKGIPLYIISATPEEALVQSVRELSLEGFGFTKILGFPKKKPDHLREIIAEKRIQSGELLFIGDSSGDYKAAQTVQCGFIGVGNEFNQWTTQSQPFPVVRLLTEIDTVVGL